jgi:hypothetical protein
MSHILKMSNSKQEDVKGVSGQQIKNDSVKTPALSVPIVVPVDGKKSSVKTSKRRKPVFLREVSGGKILIVFIFNIIFFSLLTMYIYEYPKVPRTKRMISLGNNLKGKYQMDEIQEPVNTLKERVTQVIKVIEDDVVYVYNQTYQAVYDDVIAPVKMLFNSNVKIVVLVIIVLSVILFLINFIRPLYMWCIRPVCTLQWRIFAYLCESAYLCVKQTDCMKILCTYNPFLCIRIRYRRWKYSKEIKTVEEEYGIGTMEKLLIPTDKLYTEYTVTKENGMDYVKIPIPTAKVMNASSDKESIIHGSVIFEAKVIPGFIGTFQVDGNIVGFFSRIRYQGKDCIITAAHVLAFHRESPLAMCKDAVKILMQTIKEMHVLVYSRIDESDFVIIEMPPKVFSMLALKVGTIASRITNSSIGRIFQSVEGKFGLSTAPVRTHPNKPWHLVYKMTTIKGSSGSPILDNKNRIVGIHLEHDPELKMNVGVMPPIFRNEKMLVKESPTANDAAAEDWAKQYENESESEDDYEDSMYVRDITYGDYLMDEENWGAQMDRLEEKEKFNKEVEKHTKDGITYSENTPIWARFKLGRNLPEEKRTQHKTDMISRKRVRKDKESPFVCPNCFLIHNTKEYNCSKCGHPLVRDLNIKRINEAKQAVDDIPFPLVVKDQIQKEVDPIVKYCDLTHSILDLLTKSQSRWVFPMDYDEVRTEVMKIREKQNEVDKKIDIALEVLRENRVIKGWGEAGRQEKVDKGITISVQTDFPDKMEGTLTVPAMLNTLGEPLRVQVPVIDVKVIPPKIPITSWKKQKKEIGQKLKNEKLTVEERNDYERQLAAIKTRGKNFKETAAAVPLN